MKGIYNSLNLKRVGAIFFDIQFWSLSEAIRSFFNHNIKICILIPVEIFDLFEYTRISYLCTIAKNLLMNVYQRQTVEYIYAEYVLESSEEYSDNADGELDGKLLEEYIDRLAEELPPSRKKIFVLSKRKHFTNKEIAVELNISESTVATQLSLALKFMRDKLMAHYDELLPLVIYAALIKIV